VILDECIFSFVQLGRSARRLGMFGRKFPFPAVRSDRNEWLGAPALFRHESVQRKGHGNNRQMSEIAEASLR